MKKIFAYKAAAIVLVVLLVGICFYAQFELRARRPHQSAPAMTEGVFAALGGVRSIVAEVLWFRMDRLQEAGRFVELAQLAEMLALMEPHTPEVWSYAAWNLAYNVSVMMNTHEDRWRWVEAAIRLLRDDGLRLNPNSPELCRELAWLFELKLGTNIDSASSIYREKWKAIIEDVKRRGAWQELGMDASEMAKIEQTTGFDEWTDPLMSAIYWAAKGRCTDIVQQSIIIYQKKRAKSGMVGDVER